MVTIMLDALTSVRRLIPPFLTVVALTGVAAVAHGESEDVPYWIWAAEQPQGRVPQGDCYFRKTIELPVKFSGFMEVGADDSYEVYVNGKLVGNGNSWEVMQQFDISEQLRKGKNVIAVKVTNRNGSHAGLVARIELSAQQGTRTLLSNPTWKCSPRVWPLWYSSSYRDSRWKAAKNLGLYGRAKPWSDGESPSGTSAAGRAPEADDLISDAPHQRHRSHG